MIRGPVLQSQHALGGSHIVLKGRLRFVYDADVKSVFCENLVNAFPARTICPDAVNQDNIPSAMRMVLR